MYRKVRLFVATSSFSWLPSFQLALLLYTHFASNKELSMRKMMFLYGSAGLVLVNSAALMTELIMKAVYGVRLVGDLRAIVFLSEWLFTVALLILSLLASWKPVNTESQEASRMSIDYNATPGTKHTSVDMNQMTGESVEMETLRKVSENSEEHKE
ncbi:hypothetical protein cypCar_00017340 [Cyprinus carpio]|nr:hypothetical protein cypCar_00017340 [Cyprinus carpio]